MTRSDSSTKSSRRQTAFRLALALAGALMLWPRFPAQAETANGQAATEWAYASRFSGIHAVRGASILASQGRSLMLAALATGKVQQVYRGAAGKIEAAAFSPDGQKLAAADAGGNLTIWDLASAKVIARQHESSHALTSLRWAEDGLSLAASDGKDFLLRWQAGQRAESLIISGRNHLGDYWPHRRDVTYVLVDSDDYNAPDQLLAWRKGPEPDLLSEIAPEDLRQSRLLNNELLLQRKGSFERYSLPSLRLSRQALDLEMIWQASSPIMAPFWNSDYALVKEYQSGIELYDLARQRSLGKLKPDPEDAGFLDQFALLKHSDGYSLWQIGPGGLRPVSPAFEPIQADNFETRNASLNFSPDGRWLSAGTDQRVRLAAIELASGKVFQAPLNPEMPDHSYTPGEARACFLPDGSLLAFTRSGEDVLVQYSPDHSMPEMVYYPELRRWQPVSGKIEPFKLGQGEKAREGQPNADCSLLLAGIDRELGEIWDITGRQKLLTVPYFNFEASANLSQILVEVKEYSDYHSELYDRNSGKLLFRFEDPGYLLGDPGGPFPYLINQQAQNLSEALAGEIGLYGADGKLERSLPGSIDGSVLLSTPDHRRLILTAAPRRPPEYPPTSRNADWRYQDLIVLDLASGEQRKLLGRVNSIRDGKPSLAFWQNTGAQTVFALSDYHLLGWRLHDGRLQYRFDADTAYPLLAVAVSARQDRLALMDQAGLVQVYRLPDFKRLLRKQLPWGFGG